MYKIVLEEIRESVESEGHWSILSSNQQTALVEQSLEVGLQSWMVKKVQAEVKLSRKQENIFRILLAENPQKNTLQCFGHNFWSIGS